ncbi:MAG: hypothetical protein BMS9Abin07_0160 [Acidimicrobiia bacterium]|nr:MAG: hypothetical protein BMS9Abin07_0160 [Acidimicrobiia bacterium]
MAYSSFPPVRRSRRRRWLLAALVAAVVVGLILFAVQRRTEARGIADYFAVTEAAVEQQSQAALEFEATFGSLAGMDRPELMRRIEDMHAAATEARLAIDSVVVPASAAEANGYLVVATRSWEGALALLDPAVMAVLDDDETSALDEALVLLRVGDTAYAEFLARVAAFDDSIASGDFERVVFVDPEGLFRLDTTTIGTRLRSVYQLGEHRNISITAVTDPEPVGERNNVPIVALSESFLVQAVVANEGNEAEEQISVTLELIATGRDALPIVITQTVATLEPGEARTLMFDGIELVPGGLYELVIRATTSQDEPLDDNAWRMVFYRNEDA